MCKNFPVMCLSFTGGQTKGQSRDCTGIISFSWIQSGMGAVTSSVLLAERGSELGTTNLGAHPEFNGVVSRLYHPLPDQLWGSGQTTPEMDAGAKGGARCGTHRTWSPVCLCVCDRGTNGALPEYLVPELAVYQSHGVDHKYGIKIRPVRDKMLKSKPWPNRVPESE